MALHSPLCAHPATSSKGCVAPCAAPTPHQRVQPAAAAGRQPPPPPTGHPTSPLTPAARGGGGAQAAVAAGVCPAAAGRPSGPRAPQPVRALARRVPARALPGSEQCSVVLAGCALAACILEVRLVVGALVLSCTPPRPPADPQSPTAHSALPHHHHPYRLHPTPPPLPQRVLPGHPVRGERRVPAGGEQRDGRPHLGGLQGGLAQRASHAHAPAQERRRRHNRRQAAFLSRCSKGRDRQGVPLTVDTLLSCLRMDVRDMTCSRALPNGAVSATACSHFMWLTWSRSRWQAGAVTIQRHALLVARVGG